MKLSWIDSDGVSVRELAELPALRKRSDGFLWLDIPEWVIIEDRVEGLDYRLSKCCNPVFGDSVFGFVTISEGIKIHRTSCPNAHNMMARYPYRVIAATVVKIKKQPFICCFS